MGVTHRTGIVASIVAVLESVVVCMVLKQQGADWSEDEDGAQPQQEPPPFVEKDKQGARIYDEEHVRGRTVYDSYDDLFKATGNSSPAFRSS